MEMCKRPGCIRDGRIRPGGGPRRKDNTRRADYCSVRCRVLAGRERRGTAKSQANATASRRRARGLKRQWASEGGPLPVIG